MLVIRRKAAMKTISKLLICLFVSACITACSSFSFQTDKTSVELPDKKIELEGVKIEGKSKDSEPK